MTTQEEHDLKMAFIRHLQDGAASSRPGKRPRTKGRADLCKGQEIVALGVHQQQVPEFRELTKRHGLSGIIYENDGTCRVTSQRHLREYMKLRGFSDLNSTNGS